MKFDCVKVSGKIDYVSVQEAINGGYRVTMSIDGNAIPNVKLSSSFYESIDAGETVTLYGIFKKSKRKEKNDGVIYGLKKENGEKKFATHYRFLVPLMLAVYAVLAFFIVFAIGWFVSWIPVSFIYGRTSPDEFLHHSTVFAFAEGCIAAGFFLWRACIMVKITNNPEGWESLEPATLSSRFSKYHK